MHDIRAIRENPQAFEKKASYPFYVVRLLGGVLYLAGMLVMAWNVVMTVRSGQTRPVAIPPLAGAHA